MENADQNNNYTISNDDTPTDGRNSHLSMSSDNTSQLDFNEQDYNPNNKSIVPFNPNLPSDFKKKNHSTVNINTMFVREEELPHVVKKVDKKRVKRTSVMALVIRVFAVILSFISFTVMAADNTPGWSGDSFHRYKQYRYCLAVNVIGFVYSGFQVVDLGCYLGRGNHIISNDIRYHFDFTMDQILAYLVMSASSSAATRVDDWISNWGTDKFTIMASASVAMSFLAFIAFALSSLISGYNLCTHDPA